MCVGFLFWILVGFLLRAGCFTLIVLSLFVFCVSSVCDYEILANAYLFDKAKEALSVLG